MITTLTPAHAVSEALTKKYIEHPLSDKDVKWCLESGEALISIDTKINCIWIDVSKMSFKSLAHILKTRADLGLLFPDQLYHCYCVFIRCGLDDVKLRGGEHCDHYSGQ